MTSSTTILWLDKFNYNLCMSCSTHVLPLLILKELGVVGKGNGLDTYIN